VVRGGYGRKSVETYIKYTQRIKNTSIYVLKKPPLLVDFQQKIGKLLISITSCLAITILENALN
jgi:hypothetical protein